MPGRLEGRIAVVTGAGQGIGRAVAEAFIAEGAKVHAIDIQSDRLEGLSAASVARLDVTDSDACLEYAENIGGIDVLANIVGEVKPNTALSCDDAAWDRAFDVNVKSMHRMIHAFLPFMIDRAAARKGMGSIINMGSWVSSLKGVPNRYAYGATKGAVIGMSKSIAIDFAKQGIRCNVICPGMIETPSFHERAETLGQTMGGKDKAIKTMLQSHPIGRIGKPEEVAALAVYLGSVESSFMTGSVIPIDGGAID